MVIYGRGGQDLLKDINSVLRTRVIAPFEVRVERWAEREWLDPDRARYLVRKSDQQRAGFIKYYFDRDWEDSTSYDLVINTQRLSEDMAVQVICASVKDENLEGIKASGKKVLSDLILRKRVEIAILSSNSIDAYLLEIDAEDSVVTLSGQVHSNAERTAAETQAVRLKVSKICRTTSRLLNIEQIHQTIKTFRNRFYTEAGLQGRLLYFLRRLLCWKLVPHQVSMLG